MIWLGDRRGHLSDWTTQRWVQVTGRRVRYDEHPWLDGPVGGTREIGPAFFPAYAEATGLEVGRPQPCGLLTEFADLAGPHFNPRAVHPEVARFYERTSEYALDAWSEWSRPFRPLGGLLALLFSRRLQQLNVPLSPLDTSRGITSTVYELREPDGGERVAAAWVRSLSATRNLLYAGAYSIACPPGFEGPCVRVVFPLPNGNCMVLMKPSGDARGALMLSSSGRAFGDPGFYFTLHAGDGAGWARYVRTLRETIEVYVDEAGTTRADHDLSIWGLTFLRLHYRLRRDRQVRPTGREEKRAETSRDQEP